jgi:hypothetical protein
VEISAKYLKGKGIRNCGQKNIGSKKNLKNQEKNAEQELRFMVQGVLRGQEFRKMEPQSTLSSLYS